MNYSVEINRLHVKYGATPATQPCLQECLHMFQCFSQEFLEKLKKKSEEALNLP